MFAFNDLGTDLMGNIFMTVSVAMKLSSISISGDGGRLVRWSFQSGQWSAEEGREIASGHASD